MTDAQITESLALSASGTTVATMPVVRGSVATWLLTLDGAGTIAGATLLATVRAKGSQQVLLTAEPTISDAANRIIDLTLSAVQTAFLIGDPNQPQQVVRHVCDVAVTIGGIVGIYGPLLFDVRTPA